MKSRARSMLDKSISGMLSAIEIYNKPDFKYREEIFSILCINSWELLLKAKILQLSNNKDSSLHVWEYKTLKNGNKAKKKTKKRNRSGNPMTVSLFDAFDKITFDYGLKIPRVVKDNIVSITEIRDNSTHFINNDIKLNVKIQEYGTASLQNYLHLVDEWFGCGLEQYNFYLMPVSFFRDFDSATVEVLNKSGEKLLKFIENLEKENANSDTKNFDLTLTVDVNLRKVKSHEPGIYAQQTLDQNAPKVYLSDAEILDKYPWDYDVLTTQLYKRYINFKINESFHVIKRGLIDNKKYCYERLLNPSKPKSGRKIYYSPNIVKEFDKYYKKLK